MADGQEEKPNISEHVNIKVVSQVRVSLWAASAFLAAWSTAHPTDGRVVPGGLQDGNEIQFRLKRMAPLKKLMNAYNERQGHAEGTVVFLYDGPRPNLRLGL
jgi:hypothetical protein